MSHALLYDSNTISICCQTSKLCILFTSISSFCNFGGGGQTVPANWSRKGVKSSPLKSVQRPGMWSVCSSLGEGPGGRGSQLFLLAGWRTKDSSKIDVGGPNCHVFICILKLTKGQTRMICGLYLTHGLHIWDGLIWGFKGALLPTGVQSPKQKMWPSK